MSDKIMQELARDVETRIGNNRFFPSQFDAENASESKSGAVIIETERGFCLLNPHEGATHDSIKLIHSGRRVAEKRGASWIEL